MMDKILKETTEALEQYLETRVKSQIVTHYKTFEACGRPVECYWVTYRSSNMDEFKPLISDVRKICGELFYSSEWIHSEQHIILRRR